jgi:hypothetical protein
MTKKEIEERIAKIKDVSYDDEAAHGMEDKLIHDVLIAIKDGKVRSAKSIAKAVLKVKELDFARWCS